MDSNPLHPLEMLVRLANQALPKSHVHFQSMKNSGRILEFLIIYDLTWFLVYKKIGFEKFTFVFERLVQVLVIHLSNLVWIGAKKAGAGAAESRCKLSGKRREKTQIKNKNQSKKHA